MKSLQCVIVSSFREPEVAHAIGTVLKESQPQVITLAEMAETRELYDFIVLRIPEFNSLATFDIGQVRDMFPNRPIILIHDGSVSSVTRQNVADLMHGRRHVVLGLGGRAELHPALQEAVTAVTAS